MTFDFQNNRNYRYSITLNTYTVETLIKDSSIIFENCANYFSLLFVHFGRIKHDHNQ